MIPVLLRRELSLTFLRTPIGVGFLKFQSRIACSFSWNLLFFFFLKLCNFAIGVESLGHYQIRRRELGGLVLIHDNGFHPIMVKFDRSMASEVKFQYCKDDRVMADCWWWEGIGTIG